MTKLYVISKSDLKKLSSGQSLNNRNFAMLDGEELDLEKLASGQLSSNRSFTVLDKAELDSAEHVKRAGGNLSIYFYFSMLYLGLFIGFLIATIAVDMPHRKHIVFVIGTILFGAVSLLLLIWWWLITDKEIKPQPTYTAEDAVQID